MGIDKIMNTSAYFQSIQYSSRIMDTQGEEDTGLSESAAEIPAEPADLDQIDFSEGNQAISQNRQIHGKEVYQTVGTDPALAWSVKGQTWPSAARVNQRV